MRKSGRAQRDTHGHRHTRAHLLEEGGPRGHLSASWELMPTRSIHVVSD